MNPVLDNLYVPRVWFFGFYSRTRDPMRWWGHCDAWGVTKDDTWLFLDPNRTGLHVEVAHVAEEVEALLAMRIQCAEQIIRYEIPRRTWSLPMMAPGTCAAICGAAVGLRAWTPAQLRRKLLKSGGVLHYENTTRRPGSEAAAPDGGPYGQS